MYIEPHRSQRGRPRDLTARKYVLDAAIKLAGEHKLANLSIDAISQEAGVSRPTIYRWWSQKGDIVLDALLEMTQSAVTYADTGDALADLVNHAKSYARLLRGPAGHVYRAVFAEALIDPDFNESVRDRLIRPRRDATKDALRRATAKGVLREGTDIESLIDALYAPFLYRLMLGHGAISDTFARTTVMQVLEGVLRVKGKNHGL
jgi:AcrR family transcriptional regulator